MEELLQEIIKRELGTDGLQYYHDKIKQAKIEELERCGKIAFRDERYKQTNSTQIILFGDILNRIKELESE